MVVDMRDWIADWNKWSRAERVLALLVTLILLALPLSLLITAKTLVEAVDAERDMADAASGIARRGTQLGRDQHDLVVLLGAVAEEDQFAAFRRAAIEDTAVADDKAEHLGIELRHRGGVAGADLKMADGVAHRRPFGLLRQMMRESGAAEKPLRPDGVAPKPGEP